MLVLQAHGVACVVSSTMSVLIDSDSHKLRTSVAVLENMRRQCTGRYKCQQATVSLHRTFLWQIVSWGVEWKYGRNAC